MWKPSGGRWWADLLKYAIEEDCRTRRLMTIMLLAGAIVVAAMLVR
jgi:hypothetical protein